MKTSIRWYEGTDASKCQDGDGIQGYCYITDRGDDLKLLSLQNLSREEAMRREERTDSEQDIIMAAWLSINGDMSEFLSGYSAILERANARFDAAENQRHSLSSRSSSIAATAGDRRSLSIEPQIEPNDVAMTQSDYGSDNDRTVSDHDSDSGTNGTLVSTCFDLSHRRGRPISGPRSRSASPRRVGAAIGSRAYTTYRTRDRVVEHTLSHCVASHENQAVIDRLTAGHIPRVFLADSTGLFIERKGSADHRSHRRHRVTTTTEWSVASLLTTLLRLVSFDTSANPGDRRQVFIHEALSDRVVQDQSSQLMQALNIAAPGEVRNRRVARVHSPHPSQEDLYAYCPFKKCPILADSGCTWSMCMIHCARTGGLGVACDAKIHTPLSHDSQLPSARRVRINADPRFQFRHIMLRWPSRTR